MLLMMVVAVDGDGDCMETLKAYIYIFSCRKDNSSISCNTFLLPYSPLKCPLRYRIYSSLWNCDKIDRL